MNEADSFNKSGMWYTICFGLRMRKNESLHMTTENKIGWGIQNMKSEWYFLKLLV